MNYARVVVDDHIAIEFTEGTKSVTLYVDNYSRGSEMMTAAKGYLADMSENETMIQRAARRADNGPDFTLVSTADVDVTILP